MPTLPKTHDSLIQTFAPHFSNCIWQHAQVLLLGAILAPGRRTVTAVLRIMGLSAERQFQTYHRVLSRAAWSSWALSRTLLKMLVQTFVPKGPILCALDPTIERRRGAKIKAKGIYRDPVRSSHSHFVKASGLRWLSLMLLAPIPWAGRVWALPFLTCLAPSQRYYEGKARAHKTILDWGRQIIIQLRRWLPDRKLVVVADSEFAAITWLFGLTQLPGELCLIVRLRLDAALYKPAPKRKPGTKGRPRKKGERLPTLEQVAANPKTSWQRITTPALAAGASVRNWYGEGKRVIEIVSQTAVWFHGGQPPLPIRWVLIRDPKGKFTPALAGGARETQALLCTDLEQDPAQIIKWFVLRWQAEVTYHEVREHLGVETQRQWSDLAILRTTPALLALFSLVTLLAHQHARRRKLPIRQTAWYHKAQPTFSDALALVRRQIWQMECFRMADAHTDNSKLLAQTQNRLLSALCYTP
jgi:DDE superfamily endonuclease